MEMKNNPQAWPFTTDKGLGQRERKWCDFYQRQVSFEEAEGWWRGPGHSHLPSDTSCGSALGRALHGDPPDVPAVTPSTMNPQELGDGPRSFWEGAELSLIPQAWVLFHFSPFCLVPPLPEPRWGCEIHIASVSFALNQFGWPPSIALLLAITFYWLYWGLNS
jgi:hypothetical protein